MSLFVRPDERSVRLTVPILGTMIDVVGFNDALSRMFNWSERRESRVVCVCNVHSVVTASKDSAFEHALRNSDLATPDGAPIAWLMRRLGQTAQRRVSGPDLMLAYCDWASKSAQSIFLLGSTPDTLRRLQNSLCRAYPGLRIAGAVSPPFRALTDDEDKKLVDLINESGAATVWVGLGCPKQELWMSEHKGKVQAVMIGVGAAFEFFAGTVRRAPQWVQTMGFEWLFRLASEPRRLWRRYLVTNTAFILGASRQLMRAKLDRYESADL
jgi:N-acetylglucosaminyldiphosphoundecaprenol N-acetyl-beta-D-mannosaminyltransferase